MLIMVFSAAVRVHLLEAPLERDEGEYAYVGQLILEGVAPYAEAYNMKMPGIYAAYALIMALFGQTISGIHLGLITVNAATTVLIFLLARRLYGELTGMVAAVFFSVLSMVPAVQGIFANAEHFVLLPVVGGSLLLVRAVDSGRTGEFFLSGLLFGAAFVIKQHGGVFIVFGGAYLLLSLKSRRGGWSECVSKSLFFSAGAVLPFALTCLILLQAGVFERFWFWTFIYASEYVSYNTLSGSLLRLAVRLWLIVLSSVLITAFWAVGLAALAWDKEARSRALFVTLFSLFSFLAVCPGFYFRPHYFILLLPAISVLAATGVCSIGRLFSGSTPLTRSIPFLLAFLAIFNSLHVNRAFLFQASPSEATRMTYDFNPFPESIEVAKYIEEHSNENDRIAVMGSEPQIYFYSKRRSVTGYIYTYALMEKHAYALTMQKEMITEIETSSPKFLIYISEPASWNLKPESERLILDWFKEYQRKHYLKVGVVDINLSEGTVYKWDDEAVGYSPRSKYWISVYKRRD